MFYLKNKEIKFNYVLLPMDLTNNKLVILTDITGLDEHNFQLYIYVTFNYFRTHNFKHMFWLLKKRIVSLRRFL